MERFSSFVVPYSVGASWEGSGRPHGRKSGREAVLLARRADCPGIAIAMKCAMINVSFFPQLSLALFIICLAILLHRYSSCSLPSSCPKSSQRCYPHLLLVVYYRSILAGRDIRAALPRRITILGATHSAYCCLARDAPIHTKASFGLGAVALAAITICWRQD